MDSITITDTGSYRWRLEAVNPVGTVTWSRDVTGSETLLGTGPILVDAPPFNLPATYFASDDSGTTVAAPSPTPAPSRSCPPKPPTTPTRSRSCRRRNCGTRPSPAHMPSSADPTRW